MSTLSKSGRRSAEARGAMQVASPWVEKLARLGYSAKGVVYILIGVFAIRMALWGGTAEGTRGALESIVRQPFGQVMLGLVALGLFGYAIWLFVRAAIDADNRGSGIKGLFKRIGYAINGISHLGLTFIAVQIMVGTGGDSGNAAADWTRQIMAEPLGRWIIGIGGAITIAVGLYRFYTGYRVKFREILKLSEMSSSEQKWTIRMGRVGLAAQGLVLAIIGGFFVQAAWQYQPSEARGIAGAFRALAEEPFGIVLLLTVALGVVAHGIYMFMLAQYRRIKPL